MHAGRRRGKGRSRILYWFRTPPGVRVGRSALDEDAIRLIEEHNPDVEFDWTRILKGGAETKAPEPDRPRKTPASRGSASAIRATAGEPESRRAAAAEPEFRRAAAGEPQPHRATAGGAEAHPATAGEVESHHTTAGEPEPHHATAAEPESDRDTADEPRPRDDQTQVLPVRSGGRAWGRPESDAVPLTELERPTAEEAGEPRARADRAAREEDRALAPVSEEVDPVLAFGDPTLDEYELTPSPLEVPTAALARLGSEGLSRLRARHAEIRARITERVADAERRDELNAQAERLNPDTWVTDAEVTIGLEQYETIFESLRAVVGRKRRRRKRRGGGDRWASGAGGGTDESGSVESDEREDPNEPNGSV